MGRGPGLGLLRLVFPAAAPEPVGGVGNKPSPFPVPLVALLLAFDGGKDHLLKGGIGVQLVPGLQGILF